MVLHSCMFILELTIDIQWMIDEFARMNPRQMTLINVLADSNKQLCIKRLMVRYVLY